MSVDEKDTEQEEDKTGVKENEFEPSSSKRIIKSDEATTEANANIDEDQELKALSENEEEEEKIVEDADIKSLPRATTITPIGKRKKKKKQPPLQKQHQKKEISIPNVSKRLDQQ